MNYKREVVIDWAENMANSISGQIMNNEECKKDYVRILAITMLKIDEMLKQRSGLGECNNYPEECLRCNK